MINFLKVSTKAVQNRGQIRHFKNDSSGSLKYPYLNSNSRQEQIALKDKVFLYLFRSVLFA